MDSRTTFLNDLEELGLTNIELAGQMRSWGDTRSSETIVRSLQRMTAGDTAVSGEMQVIINMLLHLQHVEDEANISLEWKEHSNGSYSAKTKDFTLSLSPQSRGRWHISIVHIGGYSHPWPQWQNSLEAAKRKALFCLADARRTVVEQTRFD